MVSDETLVEKLRSFLVTSDLATTTTAIVRRHLESEFSVDLSEKKAFIRKQVDLFLNELETENENENQHAEVEEEDLKESGGSGDEDEDEEDEDDSNGKRVSEKPKEAKKRGAGGGFTKLCSLSPQLQDLIGVSELARTQVVKKIWEYIRENNLQNPGNKRKIICDDKLQALFKVEMIDMFQMSKALSKHIWPLNSDGPAKSTRKERDDDSDESPPKAKKQKAGTSGSSALTKPIKLSDALANFLGTPECSRSDVVKRMWVYIKENNLQDPADKKNILCDDKLKELLDVESFTGFTVSKLLAAHFIKSKE